MGRVRWWVAGAAVLGTLLTACGSGASPLTLVSTTATKTEGARTADIAVTESTSLSSSGTTVIQTLSGVVDFTHHSSDIRAGSALGGNEVIVIGNDVYTKLPFLPGLTSSSKPWLHRTETATANPFTGLQSSDPGAALSYLQGVSRGVTDVGHDSVRGVAVEHYRGDVDLAAQATAAKPGVAALSKLLGIENLPVDVWIDHEGRLRQLRVSFSPKPPAGRLGALGALAAPASITITEDFFNFGVAASIQAPPANQVTSQLSLPGISSLLPTLGTQLGRPAGYTGPAYPGMAIQDHVAVNDQVQLTGYTLTATLLSRNGQQLCTNVTYHNDDSIGAEPYDSFLDWSLHLPAGSTVMAEPGNHISSGTINPGQTTSGQVCFDATAQHGQFVLMWHGPILGHSDRGIWLFQL